MAVLNNNFNNIDNNNSFSNVFKKVREYKKNNPNSNVISLGVGDASLPVIKPIVEEMKKAVIELSEEDTFKGYDKDNGYLFLKEKILENDYKYVCFHQSIQYLKMELFL